MTEFNIHSPDNPARDARSANDLLASENLFFNVSEMHKHHEHRMLRQNEPLSHEKLLLYARSLAEQFKKFARKDDFDEASPLGRKLVDLLDKAYKFDGVKAIRSFIGALNRYMEGDFTVKLIDGLDIRQEAIDANPSDYPRPDYVCGLKFIDSFGITCGKEIILQFFSGPEEAPVIPANLNKA